MGYSIRPVTAPQGGTGFSLTKATRVILYDPLLLLKGGQVSL